MKIQSVQNLIPAHKNIAFKNTQNPLEPLQNSEYEVSYDPAYFKALNKIQEQNTGKSIVQWLSKADIKAILDDIDFDEEYIEGFIHFDELNSADMLKRFWEISKTKGGMDFSDFDKKCKVIVAAEYMSMYKLDDEKDEIYRELLKRTKDCNGKLDLDFILKIFEFLNSDIFSHKISETLDLIDRYTNRDKSAREDIVECMKIINSGYYGYVMDMENFENLMELCFRNKKSGGQKFDRKKAKLMLQTLNHIECCLDEEIKRSNDWHKDPNIFLDGEYLPDSSKIVNYFNKCTNLGVKLMMKYFEKITDKNGRLLDNYPTFQEYLRNTKK